MTIADLYLVTFPQHFEWLPYLFKSIVKHVRGFRDMVIALPPCVCVPESAHILDAIDMRVHGAIIQPHLNSWKGQNAVKLQAWHNTSADEVCFVDSDLVFLREFTPDSLRTDGKLRMGYAPWEAAGPGICWKDSTAEVLGEEPPYYTMLGHPFQYPTQFVRRVYEHIGGEVGYMRGHAASEFELLGNYAALHERDSFHWEEGGHPQAWVWQGWTHGWADPDVKAKLLTKIRELGYE